jgi:hypothetical protein
MSRNISTKISDCPVGQASSIVSGQKVDCRSSRLDPGLRAEYRGSELVIGLYDRTLGIQVTWVVGRHGGTPDRKAVDGKIGCYA